MASNIPISPEYYFRIIGLHANENGHDRQVDGDWRPPRGKGKTKYKEWPSGWREYALFHHQDGTTIRLLNTPDNTPESLHLEPHGTCSMYFDQGNIWVVDCDATRHTIYDGDDNDNDASDLSQSGLTEDRTNDWSHVHFTHVDINVDPGQKMSYVAYDGREKKLIYQHRDQVWAKKLFPDRYSRMGDREVERGAQLGGLVGELPILLGLVALSVDPRGQERTVGWDDKRGVLVEVWTRRSQQHIDTLKQYERGDLVKIFK
nr:hypothetical protein B0A51_01403 [Rachicladosporium sp. CCFEE 5018]